MSRLHIFVIYRDITTHEVMRTVDDCFAPLPKLLFSFILGSVTIYEFDTTAIPRGVLPSLQVIAYVSNALHSCLLRHVKSSRLFMINFRPNSDKTRCKLIFLCHWRNYISILHERGENPLTIPFVWYTLPIVSFNNYIPHQLRLCPRDLTALDPWNP